MRNMVPGKEAGGNPRLAWAVVRYIKISFVKVSINQNSTGSPDMKAGAMA